MVWAASLRVAPSEWGATMQIDFSDGRGRVYRTNAKGTHLVKLIFKGSGLHINRIRVVPSRDDPGDWVVYPPAYKSGKDWKVDFEFNKSAPFWKIVEELAIKVVEEYSKNEDAIDDDFEDIEDNLSKAIDNFEDHNKPP